MILFLRNLLTPALIRFFVHALLFSGLCYADFTMFSYVLSIVHMEDPNLGMVAILSNLTGALTTALGVATRDIFSEGAAVVEQIANNQQQPTNNQQPTNQPTTNNQQPVASSSSGVKRPHRP